MVSEYSILAQKWSKMQRKKNDLWVFATPCWGVWVKISSSILLCKLGELAGDGPWLWLLALFTCDSWQVTRDTWHMTHDTWFKNIYLCIYRYWDYYPHTWEIQCLSYVGFCFITRSKYTYIYIIYLTIYIADIRDIYWTHWVRLPWELLSRVERQKLADKSFLIKWANYNSHFVCNLLIPFFLIIRTKYCLSSVLFLKSPIFIGKAYLPYTMQICL